MENVFTLVWFGLVAYATTRLFGPYVLGRRPTLDDAIGSAFIGMLGFSVIDMLINAVFGVAPLTALLNGALALVAAPDHQFISGLRQTVFNSLWTVIGLFLYPRIFGTSGRTASETKTED